MNKIFLNLLILFFWVKAYAQPVIIELGAEADNTIYQFQVNNSNALGANLLCGTNGGAYPRRALFKFNVADAIPAGSTVLSVSLQLNCSVSRSIADNISLHKLTASWGEGTSNAGSGSDGAGVAATANDATWLTRFYPGTTWSTQGGDYVSTASATTLVAAIGNYSWSSAAMIADIQNWIDNPLDNFGWILIGNEIGASTARKFGSKDISVAENRPKLTITYSPPGNNPVVLSHFSARLSGRIVNIQWKTSSELNHDHFELMRSDDGTKFSSIAVISSSRNSNIEEEYWFSDLEELKKTRFYRLDMIDKSGKRESSEIRIVKPLGGLNNLRLVFINRDLVLIEGVDHSMFERYILYSATGVVMLNGTLSTGTINISRLPVGTYLISVIEKNGRQNIMTFVR